jgi:tRNA(fMet)-specific endonuclease VapC
VTTQGQTRGVLDTSTVILLSRIGDATLLPAQPVITAVTLAELSVGPLVARTDEERVARQAHLQQAETALIRSRSMPRQHERSGE